MTYTVNDKCIMCKHTDCVEVCPVDCFYEGENMLVINPDECIDCGVCEPECPEDAILPDTDPEGKKWVEFNNTWSLKWPVITTKKDPLDPDNKHRKSQTGSTSTSRTNNGSGKITNEEQIQRQEEIKVAGQGEKDVSKSSHLIQRYISWAGKDTDSR